MFKPEYTYKDIVHLCLVYRARTKGPETPNLTCFTESKQGKSEGFDAATLFGLCDLEIGPMALKNNSFSFVCHFIAVSAFDLDL